MTVRVSAATLNSSDTGRTAAFWAAVLEGEVADGGNGFVHVRSATLLLIVQPAPGRPAHVETDVHLDLRADDPASTVARALASGGSLVARRSDSHGRWTVLRDPDGREFCVA
ncbi:MAG: VOC family protein [Micrococcales bacterium]|uniref:VOC family protein n=1 Tax=Cellulomonas sp. P4 TaxID=3142533 RepID=UPI0019BF491D|nr:VOC family protein [Micrococcales bacterium]